MDLYKGIGCGLLLAISLVGCDTGEEDENPLTCDGAATELEGNWEFCSGTGFHAGYQFNNNCTTVELKEFVNDDCTGNIVQETTGYYQFEIGETLTTTGGQTAKQIDVFGVHNNVYDIFMINDQSLFLGKTTTETNKLSPETRPDTLDFEIEYLKME